MWSVPCIVVVNVSYNRGLLGFKKKMVHVGLLMELQEMLKVGKCY